MQAVTAVDDDPGSGRHRACAPARAALARTDVLAHQLEEQSMLLDEHAATDNNQLGAIRDQIHEVRAEQRVMGEHVNDMRVEVGKLSTAVAGFGTVLGEQREVKHMQVIAQVETSKVATIAEIEDKSDRRKARRAFWLKVAVILIGLVGTVLGMIIERYR